MTGEDATCSITGCAGAVVTNSITGAGAVEESDGADVTSSISGAGVAWEIASADSKYSITGLNETASAGATSSITGSG